MFLCLLAMMSMVFLTDVNKVDRDSFLLLVSAIIWLPKHQFKVRIKMEKEGLSSLNFCKSGADMLCEKSELRMTS